MGMKVRDSHATLHGDDGRVLFPSGGIEIVGDDGRTLFGISLKGNELRIDSGSPSKHNGAMLDDRFVIKPIASNVIVLVKNECD